MRNVDVPHAQPPPPHNLTTILRRKEGRKHEKEGDEDEDGLVSFRGEDVFCSLGWSEKQIGLSYWLSSLVGLPT